MLAASFHVSLMILQFIFWDSILLCSPGWATQPFSASWVLRLTVYATTPSLSLPLTYDTSFRSIHWHLGKMGNICHTVRGHTTDFGQERNCVRVFKRRDCPTNIPKEGKESTKKILIPYELTLLLLSPIHHYCTFLCPAFWFGLVIGWRAWIVDFAWVFTLMCHCELACTTSS